MQPEQDLTGKLRKLPGEIQLLVEKKLELWGIQLASSLSESVAATVVKIAGVFLLFTGLFFLLFGTAFLLNEIFRSSWLGFMAQGGFFVLLGLLFLGLKNAFWKRSIKNAVLQSLLKSFGIAADQKALKESKPTPSLEAGLPNQEEKNVE